MAEQDDVDVAQAFYSAIRLLQLNHRSEEAEVLARVRDRLAPPQLTRPMLKRAGVAAFIAKDYRSFVRDPQFILRVGLQAALDPDAEVKATIRAALADEPLPEE